MEMAALLGAGLIGVVVLFQVALVLGAPWGRAAWGGQHPARLPGRLRLASLVAAILLVALAWILLAAAGVVSVAPLPKSWLDPAAWLGTAYFGLGAVMNAISRSKVERIWGPVSFLTAVCYGIVAAS